MSNENSGLPFSVGAVKKNSQEEVRIAINEFKGHVLLDLRVYAEFSAAKVPMATQKGVSIRATAIPDLIALLQRAEVKARELGILEAEEGNA